MDKSIKASIKTTCSAYHHPKKDTVNGTGWYPHWLQRAGTNKDVMDVDTASNKACSNEASVLCCALLSSSAKTMD